MPVDFPAVRVSSHQPWLSSMQMKVLLKSSALAVRSLISIGLPNPVSVCARLVQSRTLSALRCQRVAVRVGDHWRQGDWVTARGKVRSVENYNMHQRLNTVFRGFIANELFDRS
jgi:hypothetical protein